MYNRLKSSVKIFRFRVLLTCMQLLPKNATLVTYTCCLMHNLLVKKRPQPYLGDVADQHAQAAPGEDWQDADTLDNLQHIGGNTALKEAKIVRNHLRDYYNSVGAVPWQDVTVNKHVSKIYLPKLNPQ